MFICTKNKFNREIMNNKLIVSALTISAILGSASIASASMVQGVGNDITFTHGNLRSVSDLKVKQETSKVTKGKSQFESESIKMEVIAPNAFGRMTFKNDKFEGSIVGSTNPLNPDPILIGTQSTGSSKTEFTEKTSSSVSGTQKEAFNGSQTSFNLRGFSYFE